MKSVIIGCVTHYSKDIIYNYVESLNRTTFDGDKIMIVYQVDNSVIDFLQNNGFKVYRSFLKHHIFLQRFYDMPIVLRQLNKKYKYVVAVDVKDVIFQYNPIEWIEKNLGDEKKTIVSSEGLKFKDEDWNKNSMLKNFPEYANEMMDKIIYNCGSLAGEFYSTINFFDEIYKLTLKAKVDAADQAALNILIHILKPDAVKKFELNSGWCAQLAVTMDPRVLSKSEALLLEPKPIWDSKEKIMKTVDGKIFALVHQYDRIGWLRDEINQKLKK